MAPDVFRLCSTSIPCKVTRRLRFYPLQVPVEAEDLPDGSPTLSSPDHELFEDWQAARAGLAAGSQPRLAAQGTGGSYFLSNASGRNVAGACAPV